MVLLREKIKYYGANRFRGMKENDLKIIIIKFRLLQIVQGQIDPFPL